MMADLEYRVAELERRMVSMIVTGTIQELDPETARVRVKVGALVTTWLPFLTRRAGNDLEWWAPEPGEQVLVLNPNGESTVGIVLPALFQDAHPAPAADPAIHKVAYANGAFIEHDRKGNLFRVHSPGDLHATCDKNATVEAEGAVTVSARGGILHDGNASGALEGTVNGHCLCAFTGKPHAMVSASVKSSN